MSLLSAVNLGKSFGPEDIFENISVSIPHQARIGLVGPNGVGKTTLLRILADLDEPSSGSVYRARGLRIGYLPQNATLDSKRSLWNECLTAFEHLQKMQEKLSGLERAMSYDPIRTKSLLDAYGKLQTEFEHLGGYTYETRIQHTLTGLGFEKDDLERPLTQLSGGERTRAFLGRLLLTEPDVLLLDEPTNHLDIAATEWLEAYLRDWKGAVLIVSHDRYFLNQVIKTIWEMTPYMETYRGNYTAYAEQRSARYHRRLEEYKRQQAFIEKETEYIRRNIAGQNTRQAQGRRKRLERLLKEALLKKPSEIGKRQMSIRLDQIGRSGDLVLRSKKLSIGYLDDSKQLFAVPDLLLKRGGRAAVIGPNGAGKTTFLKTILGNIPPLDGQVILGASLQIGYFAQAHEDLHPELTLMEEIDAVAPHMLPAEVRSYLARFMFTEDDVYKQVSVLSGGERGRLALACLALQGANLLLLDEPTNHLDLSSQEVLESILLEFPGTILMVSHDRYLIDMLASQVWEVDSNSKTLHVFEGTYSQYKAARIEDGMDKPQQSPRRHARERKSPRIKTRNGLSKWELRRRKERLLVLETRIVKLESKQEKIGYRLEKPPEETAEVLRLGQEYQAIQDELDELIAEWSEISKVLEEER
jgi:ATP-binding cassette subfamily F protein 3